MASTFSGQAQDLVFRKDSITVFGGIYTVTDMLESFNPGTNHDNTYLIAGAYRRDLIDLPWNLVLGAEIGLGWRFGTESYGEIWAAPTIRLRAIPLGTAVMMSIGLTPGFSWITAPTGHERVRERTHGGDSKFLFYFSPELAFAFKGLPNAELVFRLHHRSGMYGTLGQMREGSNAQTIGWRFFL